MSTLRLSDDKKAIARQTARMMLEINAIHFNAEHPFVFTSGWASPVTVSPAAISPIAPIQKTDARPASRKKGRNAIRTASR